MKTNLIAVAVAAVSLTSFAAFADDCDAPGHGAYGHANYHPAAPSAPAGQHGNYELRNTQRFVAGHYENVTVQECREKRHGWRRDTICRPVVRSQWVPGSYQTVQEWVWVPSHRPQQYSQYPGHRPPPPTNQGRVGFHVSIR